MSDYNKGVNDALIGAAIGDLSVGFANAVSGHFRQKAHNNSMEQIQKRDDIIAGIKEANEINIKNGLIWKERALQAEENRDEWKSISKKFERQSDNRLIKLMEKSGSYNKSEAMRSALRAGIDKLFEEGHVDYDKEQFDHEVNEDYIQKRLALDKATKENFKEYGGGEGWLPDEDYMNNDFADFK